MKLKIKNVLFNNQLRHEAVDTTCCVYNQGEAEFIKIGNNQVCVM